MNYEQKGKIVAEIINKRDPRKNRDIYCENNKKEVKNYLEEIDLIDEDEEVQIVPNKKTERSILYITGSSGSGKSYYTKEYIKQYHLVYPKAPVYLFSSLSDDPTLDSIKYLKRIKLNDKFLNTDFTIEDFENMLVIFDDTDVISNKYMKMKLTEIRNMILETGRHTRTSFIYTSHIANKGNETKTILNEAHSITIFPNTAGARTIKYLLENIFGLDKYQIKKIKQIGTTKSRWITITKTYPLIVLHQKGAYTLRSTDD
jgi:uncharacterized protein YnzC (UPF0291/DUF896 family)